MNSNIKIRISETGIDPLILESFLIKIDEHFQPFLSTKVCLKSYSEKLSSKAVFVVATLKGQLIGLTAFYANDPIKLDAYLPLIGVIEEHRGEGIALRMLTKTVNYLKLEGFQKLSLETWLGSPAQKFYQKNHFIFEHIVSDRPRGLKSLKMFRWLGDINSEQDSFFQSPLEYHSQFSRDLCINLFLKRDDLYPKFGGGNKARKLDYILNHARSKGYNAIVSAGGAQSNHCRATALYAASLGWKVILIIHDNEPNVYEGNLKLMNLAGAELRFVRHSDVKEAMDRAMSELEKEGRTPYYIWGGGHSIEGSLAYFEAIKELKHQLGNTIPNYLIVASGTGATQAGLEVGIRCFYPSCKVIGISVSREQDRGKEEILKSMNDLNNHLKKPIEMPDDIIFDTSICGTGYEKVFPELSNTIEDSVKKGLLIDPTYSGKAFHALKILVRNGFIKANSNVVFWHTGGMLNLLSSFSVEPKKY